MCTEFETFKEIKELEKKAEALNDKIFNAIGTPKFEGLNRELNQINAKIEAKRIRQDVAKNPHKHPSTNTIQYPKFVKCTAL